MKKVYIVRHAKSDWDNDLEDFDRPLNKRGIRDAPIMAKRINDIGHKPQLIISSPAKRAITTAEYFAEEFNYPKDSIVKEKEIYSTGQKFTLQMLSELDEDVESVMVFGHNPDHSYLARYLCNTDLGNLPTCAVVGVEFDLNNWNEVKRENGKLLFYEYPKKNKKTIA